MFEQRINNLFIRCSTTIYLREQTSGIAIQCIPIVHCTKKYRLSTTSVPSTSFPSILSLVRGPSRDATRGSYVKFNPSLSPVSFLVQLRIVRTSSGSVHIPILRGRGRTFHCINRGRVLFFRFGDSLINQDVVTCRRERCGFEPAIPRKGGGGRGVNFATH